MKSSVVIADDHPIVLSGLGLLLQAESDLDLLGEATNGVDALALILQHRPRIAILDISLPGADGIQIARQVRAHCPDVGILILTQHEDRAHLRQALDAGVRGYVLKRSAALSLVGAIRGVLVGGLYIDPCMVAYMFPTSSGSRRMANPGAQLTPRETEVLKLVAAGMTAKDIAGELYVSVSSIETYKARAGDKLNIKSRSDIVRFASSQGWLTSL